MNRKTYIDKNLKVYFVLGIYAIIIMLLCAGSSPVIEYLSPDSSIFYTMGRSATKGTILYKEIADHKGFYLFAFNWLGAWLTPDSMNGLFCVEIIFAWIKLVYVYKISLLFIGKKKRAIIISLAFMAMATNFLSWNTGNLGEQFALAFQLISLFYMCKYLTEYEEERRFGEHSWKYMFIHGLVSGIVLFIQANLIAMWIPFGIGLALILIHNKYIKNFFLNLFALVAGVLISFVPVLSYGIMNNCIEDMYYIMFKVNFMYSADGRIGKSVIEYIINLFVCPSGVIIILAICGTYVTCKYYKEIHISLIVITMLVFSIFCMSVSLNPNPIYYTVYMPFAIPFFILGGKYIKENRVTMYIVVILVMTLACNLQIVKKTLWLGKSRYAYESAYEMEELIENKDAKILVLGNSMYYNCTDTYPHIKYFTIFGSGLRYETFPFCIDEQFNSLCSLENEYIMIEYKGEQYNFWQQEAFDAKMNEVLINNYENLLDYNKGGIHSALWKKKDR